MEDKENTIQFGKIDINNDELIMTNDIFSDFNKKIKEDCKRANDMLSDISKKAYEDYLPYNWEAVMNEAANKIQQQTSLF
jgi:hypothetical protein